MYDTTELKKGVKVEFENKVFIIVKSDFTNPGKGSAFVKVKLKNLESDTVIERTFKSGVSTGCSVPDCEEMDVEYMYDDQDGYNFINQKTYETIHVPKELIGDAKGYLQENIKLAILFYKGKAISVQLPNFVALEVKETDPGLKGDTAAGGLKKAIMNTGLQVNVPLFIKEGETLKIDTRTGEYSERVKG